MKLLPVPALKLAPLSVLNSQVAPASSPLTLTTPWLVMPSEPLLPLSLARAAVSAAGAVASTVSDAALLPAVLMLPAASVCTTRTAPAA